MKGATKTLTVLFTLVFALALAACAGSPKKPQRPEWIDNPGDGIVGKCGTHVRGPIAQEQCAYRKALAYLAMSKGLKVDVSAVTHMRQTATENTGHSSGSMDASVMMQGDAIPVKAHIVDKWRDRVNDVYYVLIRED